MVTHPDLDGGSSGGAEPVPVGAEAEGVDTLLGVQGVQVLTLIQVPQHGESILPEKPKDRHVQPRSNMHFVMNSKQDCFTILLHMEYNYLTKVVCDNQA